jgi:hypothetical protein
MDPATDLLTEQGSDSYKRFPDYFAASQVLLNITGGPQGQLYWNEQAADYVPFASGSAPSWTPSSLIGLTNSQLWSGYGIAWAGYVAPSDAVPVSGLWGLLGSEASYPTPCSLVSAQFPTSDLNYNLVYVDQSNDRQTETGLTLVSGWNLITVTSNGATVTFFVYGT